MPQISVLFFSILKERAGLARIAIDAPDGMTVSELKAELVRRLPGLEKAMDTAIVAVDHEFAFDGEPVPAGAEVAIFPPVSGGAKGPTYVAINEGEIDLNELLARITSRRTGAAAIFTGMVRGTTTRGEPHETLRLEYEAYRPMAEAKMGQVAREIRTRWPEVEGIAIVQRVGVLEPETPTVLIACSAAHRDTGVFEAARYGIDRLKEIVPIWKKEIGLAGEVWVEGEYTPSPEDR